MAGTRIQRRPTFFWQAILILLPVAVLAVFGWVSLRQDKLLAEHDAAERARAIADDLLPKVWNELAAKGSSRSQQLSFEVDGAGQLLCPPPYRPVPAPKPLNLAALDAEQARLWTRVCEAEAAGRIDEESIRVLKDFVASNPPEEFSASAQYQLGLFLERRGAFPGAAEAFGVILEKHSGAVGESGIPLEPLARLRLLALAAQTPLPTALSHSISVDSLCSNAVWQPTPLTPELLRRAQSLPSHGLHQGGQDLDLSNRQAQEQWHRVWQGHELSRRLFEAAQRHFQTHAPAVELLLPEANNARLSPLPERLLRSGIEGRKGSAPGPSLFWFSVPELDCRELNVIFVTNRLSASVTCPDWLAVRQDESPARHWFVCRNESELGSTLRELAKTARSIPEYFGIGVEVGGKRLGAFNPDLRSWHHASYMSKGAGGVKKEIGEDLATRVLASAVKFEAGKELLKVNVYLTSPSALFERQEARAFWFGLLILTSTIAALIGLLAAGRAFWQQQQLSELKSNFVSSVSHELRAPIASVRLMAESLERGKIQELPRQKEYFGFIVQECRRLSALIENVLDFSRIEQGRKQYEFEPTDVLALVNQTVALMQPSAAEKGVSLVWETSNIQHPTSNSDESRASIELNVDGKAIQQALVNLIDNAIKHSPKGETVTVGLEARDAKSEIRNAQNAEPALTLNSQLSTLNLFVKDHGPGIPPEEHEKIFERFYRRGSELRRETQGVGIGLSIVKHIVEAHGGRVLVESAVGQGSRFTIELPFNHRDTEAQRLK
jgi:signal transduction histidine kinase